MRLENSFDVPVAPEQAWTLLNDVPRVIPCMPGAELTETVDDSNWKAKLAVKLGPIALNFATDISRDEGDDAARHARLRARARELRGRGAGQATIDMQLTPRDGGTTVAITTDLALSGAVAQYGRGMIEDVSTQLVQSFADCLRAQLQAPASAASQAPTPATPKPVPGLKLALVALLRALVRSLRRGAGTRFERT